MFAASSGGTVIAVIVIIAVGVLVFVVDRIFQTDNSKHRRK